MPSSPLLVAPAVTAGGSGTAASTAPAVVEPDDQVRSRAADVGPALAGDPEPALRTGGDAFEVVVTERLVGDADAADRDARGDRRRRAETSMRYRYAWASTESLTAHTVSASSGSPANPDIATHGIGSPPSSTLCRYG